MKIIDPVQTVILPSRLKLPTPRAWRQIEEEGGVRLSAYARGRIRQLMLTYAVATLAARHAAPFKAVRDLIKGIAEAAEAYAAETSNETRDTTGLVAAIAALQVDDTVGFSASIYWAEAKGGDLVTLLLKLQTGHRPKDAEMSDLIADAARALSHVEDELFGDHYGPRSEAGPYFELLKVLLPMYRRRGGKIERFDYTKAEQPHDAPPVVRFVFETCNQLLPRDWPDRETFVPSHSVWSGRLKKVLTAQALTARKPK